MFPSSLSRRHRGHVLIRVNRRPSAANVVLEFSSPRGLIDDKLKAEVLEMTNGSERLDRIERILEQMVKSQENLSKSQETFGKNQETFGKNQETFGKNQETLGKNQELIDKNLAEVSLRLQEVSLRLQEMAVRQQYHDEAFERHDAEMKALKESSDADAEKIRALLRIAELHQRRFEDLERG